MDLKSKVRVIEDFPKEGISFKDITTLLSDSEALRETIDVLCEEVKDLEFDYIAGIEARGFLLAMPMAYKLNKGFIPIRKPGKLPGQTISIEYELEYGTNTVEIDKDALKEGDRVLLIDDLLATGGTAKASLQLIEATGAEIACAGFLIELTGLKGIDLFSDYKTFSLIKYEF